MRSSIRTARLTAISVLCLVRRDRNLSQELQLINPDNASYASRFNWIVGAFYMDDNSGYGPNATTGGNLVRLSDRSSSPRATIST